mmetsp:Transcript_15652/g.48481  ORF Transcript_15652/g.48481 Transcript_15652/m.48481 type:complete len:245 (-) Transcript_15652:353-1087(-)
MLLHASPHDEHRIVNSGSAPPGPVPAIADCHRTSRVGLTTFLPWTLHLPRSRKSSVGVPGGELKSPAKIIGAGLALRIWFIAGKTCARWHTRRGHSFESPLLHFICMLATKKVCPVPRCRHSARSANCRAKFGPHAIGSCGVGAGSRTRMWCKLTNSTAPLRTMMAAPSSMSLSLPSICDIARPRSALDANAMSYQSPKRWRYHEIGFASCRHTTSGAWYSICDAMDAQRFSKRHWPPGRWSGS